MKRIFNRLDRCEIKSFSIEAINYSNLKNSQTLKDQFNKFQSSCNLVLRSIATRLISFNMNASHFSHSSPIFPFILYIGCIFIGNVTESTMKINLNYKSPTRVLFKCCHKDCNCFSRLVIIIFR